MNKTDLQKGYWYRLGGHPEPVNYRQYDNSLAPDYVRVVDLHGNSCAVRDNELTPATLADLVSPRIKDETGEDVWMVEYQGDSGEYFVLSMTTGAGYSRPIALSLAASVDAPVICEAQWKELTK